MEREKYFSEYTILKKEYDKLQTVFREENDKCIRRFEENEKNSLKQLSHVQEKYNDLAKRFELIEIEKNNFEIELKELRAQDSSRDRLIHKFNRNEEEIEKVLQKLRVNNTTLLKEKENLDRELERTKSMNETKLKQITERYEMKILVLENSIKYQQEQYNASEDKAFDVLKKQESITNKLKEEYIKTVSYYENALEGLVKENKGLKKQLNLDDPSQPQRLTSYN